MYNPGVVDMANRDAVEPLTLWYRNAASAWTEALPVGDGRIGAMVFGRLGGERISLDEDSIWYGGPRDRNNPDALSNLNEIRRLLFEERVAEAAALARAALTFSSEI